MGLVLVGLSHKTAPVSLREHLTVPTPRLDQALRQLSSLNGVKEVIVLSTCNRLEIYARPDITRRQTIDSIKKFFFDLYQHPDMESALYQYEGFDAVLHLFRVASGLDSLVIGETEVLGQVKSAYQFAQNQGTTGKITNVVFQRALFVGKQVRTQTGLSEGASSVGNIAVQLAERIFGSLHDHRILLLGAGKMAEITARHLLSQKAGHLVIINRTFSKAQELAALMNGEAIPMENLMGELLRADIVIGSAASDKPLITKEMVHSLMKTRHQRSLYFIDIAVPRNVRPDVHELDNVYVYNIDDLQCIVDENLERREKSIDVAESYAKKMADELYTWIQGTLEGQQTALRHRDKLRVN
ncbi:MAG: glutamyl-tRNA reductase [Elusimicrobia bacterium]|nr:glutamyl-tRNA reductase [Candidatus Obscuribacterium magneticum]